MRHEIADPSFLETTQQDIQDNLPVGEADAALQYTLDRSCTPHCAEAIAELESIQLPSFEHMTQYVDFLREHGADARRDYNSELYRVDDGWGSVPIADLFRLNGYSVVLQGLQYDAENTDLTRAAHVGRVRASSEEDMLSKLKAYGGEKSSNWLNAIRYTLEKNGYCIVSLQIPSSKAPGTYGRHSVLALDVNDEAVTYFDPDKLAFERYGSGAGDQMIGRQDESRLLYTQDRSRFLDRMTGEVMHVYKEGGANES